MRATSLAAFASLDARNHARKFSVRTYMTEVRRFEAMLDRADRQKSALRTLAHELRPLFSDRRFISKLGPQGLSMLPTALAVSIAADRNHGVADISIRPRSKL